MSDKRSIAAMAIFAGILGACVIIGNWWLTGAVLLAAIVLIWRVPELHRGTSTGLVINKVPSTSVHSASGPSSPSSRYMR